MPSSLSNAKNGGGDYVFRWVGGTSGPNPTITYAEVPDAIPYADSTGWTLGAATADLTGNGLPDLYIANDFGPGHLLYNESTPGNIKFALAIGQRTPTTPKSFVVGKGSFKGMGVDFGDLSDNGKFDFMVSNITTAWGLEESNLVFMNEAASGRQMQQDLAHGVAPFTQDAQQLGWPGPAGPGTSRWATSSTAATWTWCRPTGLSRARSTAGLASGNGHDQRRPPLQPRELATRAAR